MTPELATKVVEHTKCAHAALDAANAELTKQAAAKAAAAAKIPDVVEALIRHDRIDPADREKAAQALADPVSALNVLLLAADPATTVTPRPIGTPAPGSGPEKRANYRYVGERSSEKSPADLAFEEAILGRRS